MFPPSLMAYTVSVLPVQSSPPHAPGHTSQPGSQLERALRREIREPLNRHRDGILGVTGGPVAAQRSASAAVAAAAGSLNAPVRVPKLLLLTDTSSYFPQIHVHELHGGIPQSVLTDLILDGLKRGPVFVIPVEQCLQSSFIQSRVRYAFCT